MLSNVKEKSWSVFLVNGYMANDQVRALRCENCKATTEVLVANHHNPNLLLYGCKASKCRHRLLRLDLTNEISNKLTFQQGTNATMAKEIYCETIAPTISSYNVDIRQT
ncbi:MAG: hypothetical protein M1540_03005 [Candidatus Bathyarchaeota archaeon]|nr:hypothetical protein [Candidatus Bathyarchaeota archaeon]